ncbi:hypothetical protein GIB67_034600 [Kingdonia uniflora]|uniref:Uncharacterized protein n=1 Tax=Kingdonia uniflora TaxID=39325 RepID=A0A7J7MY74_9MAGN|nr:hypothetical protein GIB67_034600 [Kingdonia uniflora]
MGEKCYEDPAMTVKSHHELLLTLLGSKKAAKSSILYSYKHGFSGFAAKLTNSQVEEIAEFPGVLQVIPNRFHKLHTTRNWDFLGLPPHSSGNLLSQSNMGKQTIIGLIDTGIWPELESFNDISMGPIPSHWKEKVMNTNRSGIKDFISPRDRAGHGTYTASTAAGCFVENASYRGLTADILKAFDKAIYDGVDILSVSIGNEVPLFPYVDHCDSIAIGSFHAISRGITVGTTIIVRRVGLDTEPEEGTTQLSPVHRGWSPAAIRSALVTTVLTKSRKIAASQTGTDEEHIIADGVTQKPADAFDIGGGHVNLTKAANPGLIYNISTEGYVKFFCSMGYSSSEITNLTMIAIPCRKNKHLGRDINLPSISNPNLMKSVTVLRTVTNVGPTNSVNQAMVQSPPGVKMIVKPQTLSFNLTTAVLTFKVTFSSTQKVHGDYSFGSLTWTDGIHSVRSPVVVRIIKYESYADM